MSNHTDDNGYDLIVNGTWESFCDNFGSKNHLAESQPIVKHSSGKKLVVIQLEQAVKPANDWAWVSLDVSIYKSKIAAKVSPRDTLKLTYASGRDYNLLLRMNALDTATAAATAFDLTLPASATRRSTKIAISEFKDSHGKTLKETQEVSGFTFFVMFPPAGGSSHIRLEEFALTEFSSPINQVEEYYKKMTIGHMGLELLDSYFLFDFLTKHKITRTLEVGLGEGVSAMAIMLATGAQHTAIDPLTFCTTGVHNMEVIELSKQLRLLVMLSQYALPKLCELQARFQFSFLAGGCKLEDFMNDFNYVSQMTEIDGYIMIPDSNLPSMPTFISYIANNRADFVALATPQHSNLCLWKKIAEDQRQWDHHSAF